MTTDEGWDSNLVHTSMTRTQINLTHLTWLEHYESFDATLYADCFYKFVLLSNPSYKTLDSYKNKK